MHALPNFRRQLLGASFNTLGLVFDANEEPMLSAGGPASDQLTGSGAGQTLAQTKPAAFTTVGGNPPSGLVGELLVDDVEYLFKRLEVNMDNGLSLRQEYGVSTAGSAVCRTGRREVTGSLEAWLESESTLYDPMEDGTDVAIHKQTGFTEGNIIALYMPRVEVMSNSQDDPDSAVSWTFDLMGLESVIDTNDELKLAIA